MPTKEKVNVPDPSIDLLTAIRDAQKETLELQKQQTALMAEAVAKFVRNAKVQRRDKIIKIVFYALIVAFSMVSTYYFYRTIGASLNLGNIGGGLI